MSKPFWAKCSACGHIWPAAYLPMEMAKAARVFRSIRCPKCAAGPKGIVPAKQDDGNLLEPEVPE